MHEAPLGHAISCSPSSTQTVCPGYCTILTDDPGVPVSGKHAYGVGGGGLHIVFGAQLTFTDAMHLSAPSRRTVQLRGAPLSESPGVAGSAAGRGGFDITVFGGADWTHAAAGSAASVTTNGLAKLRRNVRALMVATSLPQKMWLKLM